MKRIMYRLYKVSSVISMRNTFVECESEKDLIEYMALHWQGEPASVVEVLNNGRTPKVALYTNKYYKEITKKSFEGMLNPKVREIKGSLYRLKDQSIGTIWFVECQNEMELMHYIAHECQGIPLNVVYISRDGRTPKVAVYTNAYYKDLIRKLRKSEK